MRIRAKLTLRNELVLKAREKLGFTQAKMAQAAGITLPSFCRIELLQFDRVRESEIKKLADFMGVKPETLVPPDLRKLHLPSSSFVVQEIPTASLLGLKQPILLEDKDKALVDEELRKVMAQALDTLSFSDREVLKMRYGIGGHELSLKEIARVLRVSDTRVQQIEKRALRRMMHPVRSKRILKVTEGDSEVQENNEDGS